MYYRKLQQSNLSNSHKQRIIVIVFVKYISLLNHDRLVEFAAINIVGYWYLYNFMINCNVILNG